MKSISSDGYRRAWNADHGRLRRALADEAAFPAAMMLFRRHHAAVHAARLSRESGWSFQDEVLGGLAEAEWRRTARPGDHSLVWLIWHITRIEDAAIHGLLAGPQVLHTGLWRERLGTEFVDVGNQMDTDESERLSRTLNVKALLAYRLAVGRRTRQVIARLKPADLRRRPAPERLAALTADGSVPKGAGWLLTYWGSHPKANLLLMPASRHAFVHLNEARLLIAALRRGKG